MTDRQMDGHTDRRTDISIYRVASVLKIVVIKWFKNSAKISTVCRKPLLFGILIIWTDSIDILRSVITPELQFKTSVELYCLSDIG